MSSLILGDAESSARLLRNESVNSVVMSPPYWMQRDYGTDGQIGRERTVREYLERLWAVLREVWRVLTPEGTCFVNLGDKYIGKRRMLIPERFTVGMDDMGWITRNAIIWHKKNPKPESIRSRFSNDWEAIYFFAKSERHYFATQYEPYSQSSVKRCVQFLKNGEHFDPSQHKHDPANVRQASMCITERVAKNLCIPGQIPHGMHLERNVGKGRDLFDVRGRRMRCVWSLPVGRYRGAHYATWPPELVRRLIMAGCPPGGTVLDLFVGSGTSIVEAENLGCVGIGVDNNRDYLELAQQRILEARAKRAAMNLRNMPGSAAASYASGPTIHGNK